MKIIHFLFSYAVFFSFSSLAQSSLFLSSPPIHWAYNAPTLASWLKPENQFNPLYLITSTSPVSANFSIEGVQTSYWLDHEQGQIEMTITTHEHLFITAYLYNVDGHEKAQAATLINNRTKNLILPLENIIAGNYRLVIKALATDHQASIKVFHITLTDTAL